MDNAGSTISAPPTAPESVQQRLEQIAAAVAEAHSVLDGIVPRDVISIDQSAVEPARPGVEQVVVSVESNLQELIQRLKNVADRVGQL